MTKEKTEQMRRALVRARTIIEGERAYLADSYELATVGLNGLPPNERYDVERLDDALEEIGAALAP